MKKILSLLLLAGSGQIFGQVNITGNRIDLTHAQATRPIKVVTVLPTGVPPQLGCLPGDMVQLAVAPLSNQIYINSGTGICVWTQQGGGSGGGGLADPGANGVIKRTALNVTAPALFGDIVTLFSGCSGTMLLGADGACHTPVSTGLADPGANGPIKRTALNVTAPSLAADIVGLFAGCSGTQYLGADAACHTAAGGLNDPGSNGIVKRTAFNVTARALSADVIGLFTGCSGTQYLGADGACHSVSSGGSYVTAATTSPQTILASAHGQGINADLFCFSGAISSGATTGHQVLCDYSKDLSGNIVVTWAGSTVGSLQVFASGAGPAGPPGPGTTPGGVSGQIQYNSTGSFGGFTASGDATINTATGVVSVTKTGGVAFAPSATTDTTNAANILSGVLGVPRGGSGIGTLTGVIKGNGTSAFSAALAADIVGLFSGCSGANYLGADGACHSSTGTPAGVSGDLQINSSGSFGAVHPPVTAGFPRWNGSVWAIGDIPVGSSGGLDCSSTHGQCDIVTTVVPRFGFNWVQNGLVNFGGSSSTLPNRSGTGSPNARDNCVNVGETFFQTDATPGANLWGCTGTGTPGTWTLQSSGGGGGGSPYVVNASSSPQTITAATHGQGKNPWFFCWDGAVSSGATTGNFVQCAASKNSAGDLTIYYTSGVASIEVMAAGSGGGGGGSFGPVLTSAPITGGPITTTGTISCPTCGVIVGTPHSTAIVTSNGSTGLQTPSSAATVDGFGDIGTAGYVEALSGFFCNQFPDPGNPSANTFGWVCPTSVPSSYRWMFPSADAAGVLTSDGGGTPGHISISATTGTGNILRASAAAPATSGSVPLKGNGSGGFSAATAADIVTLFTGCSGTQYLGADGACHTAAGGGLADPGSNGIVKRIAPTITAPANPGTDYALPPSGSAILKANGTGGFAATAAADVVTLFSGCSGVNYLGADGACHLPTGTPGGSTGQIQFNNSGIFGGFTPSGDATVNTSTGVVTVSKTGGTPFAASATTDTTNATNITSGILGVPRGGSGAGTLSGLLRGNGTSPFTAATAADVNALGAITNNTSGNAGTATQLAGTPTLCPPGQAPTGILPNGNATGCAAINGANPLTAATAGVGTVAVSGTTVTGSGTSFSGLFPLCSPSCSHGEAIVVYPAATTPSGYLTATPIPGYAGSGYTPGALLWGVDGTTFSLNQGDTVTPTRTYGTNSGVAGAQREFWSVNTAISSNKVPTLISVYPQVGSVYPYPYINVISGVAYIITSTPSGGANSQTVVVAGSPAGAWDGSYVISDAYTHYSIGYSNISTILTTSNPRSLADGIYMSESLTMTISAAPIGNSPTVSVVVAGGTATATFIRPHGFSVGDSVHVSGFTSGCSALNVSSATVSSIGNTDWPTILTFSTGAGNMTCAQQAGVISAAFTANPHPIWSPITSVSSNTSLTLSTSSGTVASGATYASAPDNASAYQTAIAAGKDIVISTAGNYFFNNANTAALAVTGFNNYFGVTSGATFTLANPAQNGFTFNGGTGYTLSGWTVNSLYQAPSQVIGGFQVVIGAAFSSRPKFLNLTCWVCDGNFLDVENTTQPQAIGIRANNVIGGPFVFAANSQSQISDVQGRNNTDLSGIYNQNNYTDQNMRGATVTNISLVNPGIGLGLIGPDITATNIYIEGSQYNGLNIQHANSDVGQIKVSHAQINNSQTLGPASQIGSFPAAVFVSGTEGGVTLDDISVNQAWGNGIEVYNSSATIRNADVSNTTGVGIYSASSAVSVANSSTSNTTLLGMLTQGGALATSSVQVDGLTVTNAAQGCAASPTICFPSHTGDSVILSGDYSDDFKNVRIVDTQTIATGYQLFSGGACNISNCGFNGYGRYEGITGRIKDSGHAFKSYGGLGGIDYFRNAGYAAAAISTTSVISPVSEYSVLNGSTSIVTITPPKGMQPQDQFCIQFQTTGLFITGGNIGAGAAVAVGHVQCERWDGTSFWPMP